MTGMCHAEPLRRDLMMCSARVPMQTRAFADQVCRSQAHTHGFVALSEEVWRQTAARQGPDRERLIAQAKASIEAANLAYTELEYRVTAGKTARLVAKADAHGYKQAVAALNREAFAADFNRPKNLALGAASLGMQMGLTAAPDSYALEVGAITVGAASTAVSQLDFDGLLATSMAGKVSARRILKVSSVRKAVVIGGIEFAAGALNLHASESSKKYTEALETAVVIGLAVLSVKAAIVAGPVLLTAAVVLGVTESAVSVVDYYGKHIKTTSPGIKR